MEEVIATIYHGLLERALSVLILSSPLTITAYWLGTLWGRKSRLWEWFVIIGIWAAYFAILRLLAILAVALLVR